MEGNTQLCGRYGNNGESGGSKKYFYMSFVNMKYEMLAGRKFTNDQPSLHTTAGQEYLQQNSE